MDLLKPDYEHRAIMLDKYRRPDLDHVVRSDREEEAVERCMVKLTEGHAVAHRGLALELAVWCDVRSVQ